jgi:hypothetical protein
MGTGTLRPDKLPSRHFLEDFLGLAPAQPFLLPATLLQRRRAQRRSRSAASSGRSPSTRRGILDRHGGRPAPLSALTITSRDLGAFKQRERAYSTSSSQCMLFTPLIRRLTLLIAHRFGATRGSAEICRDVKERNLHSRTRPHQQQSAAPGSGKETCSGIYWITRVSWSAALSRMV